MRTLKVLIWAALLLTLGASPAAADEGLWPLEALPVKQLKGVVGVTLDEAWLTRARLATVQLSMEGSCSASFVSDTGLLLTNRHCVDACVTVVSAQKKTKATEAFLAKTMADEPACTLGEVRQLLTTTDVTERLRSAAQDQLNAAISALETECVGAEGATIRCKVVTLYQGGQFVLFRSKRYRDLRLVFAPEIAIGLFGGDPDNFNFPRFSVDFALLRAYEKGAPAVTAEHFALRPEGASVDEPVLMVGFPGTTGRQLTVAELEHLRDVELPASLGAASYAEGMLNEYARTNPRAREATRVPLIWLQNDLKIFRGQLRTLGAPGFFEGKQTLERTVRKALAANPALAKELGDPWADQAAVLAKSPALWARYQALRPPEGIVATALQVVRGVNQRAKPEADRLPEFSERNLATLRGALAEATRPSKESKELQERFIAHWLYAMRNELGLEEPALKTILGRRSPEAVARDLVARTRLFDDASRTAMWDGDVRGIELSKDPAIALARVLDPVLLAAKTRFDQEIASPRASASRRIALAQFAVRAKGVETYPDANFTLRLSYGRVKGWQRADGVTIAPFTNFAGLLARAGDEDPYLLPPRWESAKARLHGATPLNFVTTNDFVGGASGSPMLDTQGRLVGVAFDGNLDSIGGEVWYDGQSNRAIGVHVGALLETLNAVYGAERLSGELGAQAH